jgi:glutathione synthase
MKICFVINFLASETAGTTVAMMRKAHQRGHTVYVMDVGGFFYQHNSPLTIHCVRVPQGITTETLESFLAELQAKPKWETIPVTTLDVLFLRNNPTEEGADRHWAEHAGISFGRMVQSQGVMVLNDAFGLSYAFVDKLYFEELPQEIKPKSIVTRRKEDVLKFYEEMGNKMVLKPLEGSGGQNVFLVDEHEKNLNQIFDTISAGGYVIAQEFLPEVSKGDIRILLMNGRVLEEDGHKAVIRRVAGDGEFRSNFSQGASADSSELTPAMERIIEVVAPKVIRDGLFLIGLDVVDDKLIEINLLSPGGLHYFKDIDLPEFTDSVIAAIERKVEYKKMYGSRIPNQTLATMQ